MKDKDRMMFYISLVVIGIVMAWFVMLMFIPIPSDNKDLVTTASGVLLGSGVTQILNWWFGSSKGSHDKNDLINK